MAEAHDSDRVPVTGNAKIDLSVRWDRPRSYAGRIGELSGPEATSRNDAAAAVVAAAAAALTGSYTPVLIRVAGVETALLVYHDPHAGHVYKFVDLSPLPSGTSRAERLAYTSAGAWTKEQAMRSGRRHLAEYLQGSGVDFSVAVEAIDPADHQGREEFARLEGYHRAWRAAGDCGISDDAERRHWAYDHEPEFTPTLPEVTKP